MGFLDRSYTFTLTNAAGEQVCTVFIKAANRQAAWPKAYAAFQQEGKNPREEGSQITLERLQ